MQQADMERETFLPEDGGTTTMTSSWKLQLLQIFLILLSCRHVNTKTAVPTTTPLPDTHLNTTYKSAILKGENLTLTVELTDPVIMTLNCTWTGKENKLVPNITGHWEKNGQVDANSSVTLELQNDQYNLIYMFRVINETDLGNYSCVFGNEARADFILTVPQMDNKRDKPVVGYLRDFVSMACKMEETKPKPKTFHWFKSYGTEEQILDAAAPELYKISSVNYTTKLTLRNLSLEDSGWYYCSAVYPVGSSMSKVELKVITFMEPLKPFIAILIEVVVLVVLILLCERIRAKKNKEGTQTTAEQKNTESREDDKGAEGRSSLRQRKA